MIRGLLYFLIVLVIYSVLKSVFRSMFKIHRDDDHRHDKQIKGEDMVLDPECRTYVVKDRAVTRRIRGTLTHFCSEECARRHEDKNRA